MAPGLAVAKKAVTAPPWIFTVVVLGGTFVSGALGVAEVTAPLGRGLTWFCLAVVVGWMWSIYRVSTAALGERASPAWINWAFLAPIAIHGIASVTGLSMDNSPPAFLFFAALLFCIGQAANALEAADPAEKPASFGKTFGTALLLFFSPVGVWWLRQRLLRVAARTGFA